MEIRVVRQLYMWQKNVNKFSNSLEITNVRENDTFLGLIDPPVFSGMPTLRSPTTVRCLILMALQPN